MSNITTAHQTFTSLIENAEVEQINGFHIAAWGVFEGVEGSYEISVLNDKLHAPSASISVSTLTGKEGQRDGLESADLYIDAYDAETIGDGIREALKQIDAKRTIS